MKNKNKNMIIIYFLKFFTIFCRFFHLIDIIMFYVDIIIDKLEGWSKGLWTHNEKNIYNDK